MLTHPFRIVPILISHAAEESWERIAAALVPHIGYDNVAVLIKTAFSEGRGVREVALEMDVLPEDELDAALDMRPMTEGG